MRLSHIFVLFVTVVLLIDDSDAGRRRRWIRIRGRRILNRICRTVCGTHCGSGASCTYGCKKVCSGKREIKESAENGQFVLKLPCKFDGWDLNNDGNISLEEFAFTGHAGLDDATKEIFNKVDTNGDGRITEDELDGAPLVRETC